jgi:hypothetical protein
MTRWRGRPRPSSSTKEPLADRDPGCFATASDSEHHLPTGGVAAGMDDAAALMPARDPARANRRARDEARPGADQCSISPGARSGQHHVANR